MVEAAIPRKTYELFFEDFSQAMRQRHPESCFYIYGSFYRGEHNPNTLSDIDGGIILDSKVATDKREVFRLAWTLNHCLERNRVPVQFNLLDRQSSADGRFLSYTADYVKHIWNEGRVVTVPNFVAEMRLMDYKSGPLNTSAFSFRAARNNLLHSLDDICYDSEKFRDGFRSALGKLRKLPKKLIWLRGQEDIVTDGDEAVKILQEILPNWDSSRMGEIERFRNVAYRNEYVKTAEDEFKILFAAATEMEKMIQAYIEKFPDVTEREARG